MENYKKLELIGKGTYGKIYKVKSTDGNFYALKKFLLFDLDDIDNSGFYGFLREITILNKFQGHKNIIPYKNFFIHNKKFYLCTKLCSGDLHFFNSSHLYLKSILSQLFSILSVLHKNNIIHRDINSRNIVYDIIDHDINIYLIDFGLSKFDIKPLTPDLCSVSHRAPELLLNSINYDNKVDLWSVGILIIHLLLNNSSLSPIDIPFIYKKTELDVISDILTYFDTDIFNFLNIPYQKKNLFYLLKTFSSPHIQDFDLLLDLLSHLLVVDPSHRFNIDQVLSHPYFSNSLFPSFNITPLIKPNSNLIIKNHIYFNFDSRTILFEWLSELCIIYCHDNLYITFLFTVMIFDSYLTFTTNIDISLFQLIICACFYISYSYIHPNLLLLKYLVYDSDDLFTISHLSSKIIDILQTFNFILPSFPFYITYHNHDLFKLFVHLLSNHILDMSFPSLKSLLSISYPKLSPFIIHTIL